MGQGLGKGHGAGGKLVGLGAVENHGPGIDGHTGHEPRGIGRRASGRDAEQAAAGYETLQGPPVFRGDLAIGVEQRTVQVREQRDAGIVQGGHLL